MYNYIVYKGNWLENLIDKLSDNIILWSVLEWSSSCFLWGGNDKRNTRYVQIFALGLCFLIYYIHITGCFRLFEMPDTLLSRYFFQNTFGNQPCTKPFTKMQQLIVGSSEFISFLRLFFHTCDDNADTIQ